MENLTQSLASLLIGIIAVLILSFPVMWLWNSFLVPAIDGVNPITYWQTVGIWVLINIFKNSAKSSTKKD